MITISKGTELDQFVPWNNAVIYPLVNVYSSLLKRLQFAIENVLLAVDLPAEDCDFP